MVGFRCSRTHRSLLMLLPSTWSSVKKSYDPCLPPAYGLSRKPDPTTRRRSITITNISTPACETCLPRWAWLHKERQSFFIFSNKRLDGRLLRHLRVMPQKRVTSREGTRGSAKPRKKDGHRCRGRDSRSEERRVGK